MADIVERVARAMRASKAWPVVFGVGSAETLARVAIGEMDDELTRLRAENRRLAAGRNAVIEALTDATANLAGAASAYRKYAARHRSVGRAVSDPFFITRANDFEKAAKRARATLRALKEPDNA